MSIFELKSRMAENGKPIGIIWTSKRGSTLNTLLNEVVAN